MSKARAVIGNVLAFPMPFPEAVHVHGSLNVIITEGAHNGQGEWGHNHHATTAQHTSDAAPRRRGLLQVTEDGEQ